MNIRRGVNNNSRMKPEQEIKSKAHQHSRRPDARVDPSDQSFKGWRNNTLARPHQSGKPKKPKNPTPFFGPGDLQEIGELLEIDVNNFIHDFKNLGKAFESLFESQQETGTDTVQPKISKAEVQPKRGSEEDADFKALLDHFSTSSPPSA